MGIVILGIWGISSCVGLGIFIWGIVAASTTKDTELSVGKLLLHLFLWGWVIAAIIYALKVDSNKTSLTTTVAATETKTETKAKSEETEESKPATKNESDSDEDKFTKIDKLLKEKKITKEEHKQLRKKILEEI